MKKILLILLATISFAKLNAQTIYPNEVIGLDANGRQLKTLWVGYKYSGLSANTTITPGNTYESIEVAGTGTYTITIAADATTLAGTIKQFRNNNPNALTIQFATGVTISNLVNGTYTPVSAGSFVIPSGGQAMIVSSGSNVWRVMLDNYLLNAVTTPLYIEQTGAYTLVNNPRQTVAATGSSAQTFTMAIATTKGYYTTITCDNTAGLTLAQTQGDSFIGSGATTTAGTGHGLTLSNGASITYFVKTANTGVGGVYRVTHILGTVSTY